MINLKVLNTGSHFSEDKFNMAILYAVLLCVFFTLLGVNYKKY